MTSQGTGRTTLFVINVCMTLVGLLLIFSSGSDLKLYVYGVVLFFSGFLAALILAMTGIILDAIKLRESKSAPTAPSNQA